MALVVNNNLASVIALTNLNKAGAALEGNIERLSSGLRIVKAADDPAGLAISESLRAKIRATSVATRNANDGISLLQVAEGALNEVNSILVRLRELSTQAANPTLGSTERNLLNLEFLRLKSEIDRIAQVTEFNGQVLINGALSTETANTNKIQVGITATANDTIQLQISAATIANLALTGQTLSDVSAASSAISLTQAAITNAVGIRGSIGAVQSRLTSSINNLSVSGQNLIGAESRIRDADFGFETAQFTKNQILVQASTAILAQANLLPSAALSLLG
jgi:flagellin